ncbi:formylmethanofuran dehydrogenase subunit E family protein [Halosolutus amylolyticus]|uniref:Formylmethanofuran dehydrogenase subunit E family protein n=1 Tax=Halosolutus amylolyticus TaxID=2932267 RepID=A0ABD5PLX6_9EURY|nr:formylmethanofuran dehydrogenase subunit E family protein [Halosolutus amylolyticus]
MTDTTTDPDRTSTNWKVDYEDVEPIRLRDPAAEALAVVDPDDPIVVTYEDVVKAAGHSCPTAAGAYRIAQAGLDALYPGDELPVRGNVAVLAGGPRDDPAYGVTSRLVSYVTGAAGEDGFAGLAGGHGGRKDLLRFGAIGVDGIAFEFTRTDTDETVRITYDTSKIPDAGPATRHLPALIEGDATDAEREEFTAAWHDRVDAILRGDRYVTVDPQ